MATAAKQPDIFPATARGAVPGTRTVKDLQAALGMVTRSGGSIASEVRTAPGIGSWAFVADRDGRELVLWQNAS